MRAIAAAAIALAALSSGGAHAASCDPGEWLRQGAALLRALVERPAAGPEVIVPPANVDPKMAVVPPGPPPPMRIFVPPGGGWRL